jgi:hypothetical protein
MSNLSCAVQIQATAIRPASTLVIANRCAFSSAAMISNALTWLSSSPEFMNCCNSAGLPSMDRVVVHLVTAMMSIHETAMAWFAHD